MAAFIFSEKMVLVVVTLVGMSFCSVGIGQVAARNEWLHPMAFLAYGLGILILGIAGGTLFNVNLPLIASTRAAIIAVVVLIVAKIVLTQLHRLLA